MTVSSVADNKVPRLENSFPRIVLKGGLVSPSSGFSVSALLDQVLVPTVFFWIKSVAFFKKLLAEPEAPAQTIQQFVAGPGR